MQIAGAVARAVRRRLSWETVGIALSLVIIAAACFTLFQLLRDVDVGKFADAIYATPIEAVVVAAPADRRQLCLPDLLRFLRAAHDRPDAHSVSDRGAHRISELHDRTQSRRDGLHRRRGALPHLSGVGPHPDRRRQGRLRHRPHVLARQRRRARRRHRLRARGRRRDQPAAGVGQPGDRAHRARCSSRSICSGCCRGRASSDATAGS